MARQYYERRSKELLYEKGKLVGLHDPVAKRGKARKFAYQYRGPYMIVARISPLIYRVKVGEGRFIIVHVNRLKKVHSRRSVPMQPQQEALREEVNPLKSPKLQADRTSSRNVVTMISGCVPAAIRSREQAVEEEVQGNLLESRLVDDSSSDPDWAPGTQYLKKKLSFERKMISAPADGVQYALRTRTSRDQSEEQGTSLEPNEPSTSEPLQPVEAELLTPSKEACENLNTVPQVPRAPSHSYNLRDRGKLT